MTFSKMTLSVIELLDWVSFTYAECHIKAPYAYCRYAECRYTECRGAIYTPIHNTWITFRVPNKATHGYDEGLIDSSDGDKGQTL